MKLKDIMVREVVTVSPEESTASAARRMREKSVGCLVVILDKAIKGIVTDRDLLACLGESHDPRDCKISTHMSRPVIVERPEEELLRAAEIMAERRIKRLPVVERGELVGLVSFSDISRIMAEQAQAYGSMWASVTRLIRAENLRHRSTKPSSAPAP